MIINNLNWLRALLATVLMLGAVETSAAPYAALVIETHSNRVLYEKNANALRHPASLVKMMTLYMVFDALDRGKLSLNTRLRVSQYAASRPPTNLHLKKGDTITVKEAILGLVTKSANDVAAVVAEHLGQSEADFARMMTQKAKTLGMTRTVFRNASGLPDSKQVTTAWDMARLGKALLTRFPHHYHYFSTRSFIFRNGSYRNHNHLLKNYSGTDGIKTGYINASGFNLVASVKRGDNRLIGVVFGGRSGATRDAHMRQLLSDSFAQLTITASGVKTAKAQPLDIKSMVRSAQETQKATPDPRRTAPPRQPRKPAFFAAKSEPRAIRSAGGPADNPGNEAAGRYAGSAWKVRLGTFTEAKSAEQRISQAKSMAASHFHQARHDIRPHLEEGRKVYVAYLLGLSFNEATQACRVLRRQRFECLPVYVSAG